MSVEQHEVQDILAQYDQDRDNLIPLLQDVQDRLHYLSPQALSAVAEHLQLSENDVFGVATFYAQFRFTPPGRHSIRVCLGTACHVRGGATLLEMIERSLGIGCGETTPDGRFDVERVACLGCCALSPVVQIDGEIFSRVTVNKLTELLKGYE